MSASIAIVHLGCEKNRVDTEHMMGLLAQAGYSLVPQPDAADFVLVNTCSFITAAREEGVELLCELEAKGKRIIITGCMAQQFRSDLLKEIPAAMAVVGTGDYAGIVGVMDEVMKGRKVERVSDEPTFLADENVPRVLTSQTGVGWLRVAEGCDCRCSFCIIPRLRGRQRSRTIESIVAEAEKLAAAGVKELILIAQNTTNYGIDLYGKQALPELLDRLQKVAVPWIRVHYAYPTGVTSAVLEAMARNDKVLPYFDLPLQHAHPEILRSMKRPSGEEHTSKLVERIRRRFPEATLRTTFIVGYPGEGREHFNHLLNFVRTTEFDHVGVFCYSPEEGTPAFELRGRVRRETSERRREAIMAAQQGISKRRNARLVGSEVRVLVEGRGEGDLEEYWKGRSERFAPDVDGQVYVKSAGTLAPGQLVTAKIVASDVYDLFGEVPR